MCIRDRVHYSASATAAPFRRCDFKNLGLSKLCDLAAAAATSATLTFSSNAEEEEGGDGGRDDDNQGYQPARLVPPIFGQNVLDVCKMKMEKRPTINLNCGFF